MKCAAVAFAKYCPTNEGISSAARGKEHSL
jgi:hypothetical protein